MVRSAPSDTNNRWNVIKRGYYHGMGYVVHNKSDKYVASELSKKVCPFTNTDPLWEVL